MDQSVALMAQVEKSGVNSETVMQGMRKALKNATKEGIPLNDALAKLQKTIKEGKSDTDGLTEAYELFGKYKGYYPYYYFFGNLKATKKGYTGLSTSNSGVN